MWEKLLGVKVQLPPLTWSCVTTCSTRLNFGKRLDKAETRRKVNAALTQMHDKWP